MLDVTNVPFFTLHGVVEMLFLETQFSKIKFVLFNSYFLKVWQFLVGKGQEGIFNGSL